MELRPHQLVMLSRFLAHPRYMDTSEPSTGKTATACMHALLLWRSAHIRTVFLCPTSLLEKNADECVLWGFGEAEVKIIRKSCDIAPSSGAVVYLMSYARFKSDWDKLPADVDLVIADECHAYWSTHTSASTQSMYRASRRFTYFHLMTGTPITSKLDSVYPFLAIAAPRAYCTHQNFMNAHGVFDRWGHIAGWKNHTRLVQVFSQFSSGFTIKEVYPNTAQNLLFFQRCPLDEHQREKYLEFEKEALVEMDVEDKFLETDNNAVKALRCRQILSAPRSVGISPKFLGKMDVLREHLSNGGSFVVFSVFDEEMDEACKLCAELGIAYGRIDGSVSGKKRAEIDARFRAGELQVIVGSVKTCAVGFNWEHVSEIIFLSTSYEYSDLKQGVLRGNRGKRTSALPVYVLHYGTKVEKRIFTIMKRKEKDAGAVLTSS